MILALRPLEPGDLPIFFDHQRDPVATRMVGFRARDPDDRDAFFAHWARISARPDVVHRTIVADGVVAGYASTFEREQVREICYFLGREHWRKGIATRAVRTFLTEVVLARPLYASVVHDNVGSRRVLEACGFREIGHELAFAEARGKEEMEIRYQLAADVP